MRASTTLQSATFGAQSPFVSCSGRASERSDEVMKARCPGCALGCPTLGAEQCC